MNNSSRWIVPDANRYRRLPCISVSGAVLVSLVLAASRGDAKAHSQQYSIVARLDVNRAEPTAGEITVRIGNANVPATTIKANPDVPRRIAIVIDAGPDQTNVLGREKGLAIVLINEFSDTNTTFIIATCGTSSNPHTASDGSTATERVRDIVAATGVKRNVPIYDPIGSVMRQVSLGPGLRMVIFIGEGNDGGSKMRYSELRSLAELDHIAFFAALVADHSLRGTKSILRYGWNLRELANDTSGIFLENEKTPKATRRLSESIRGLRLITFEMPSLPSGNYKSSVSHQGKKLRAQRALVIP